jgi:ABC-type multidrug transport system fused ATPase/permease subunit
MRALSLAKPKVPASPAQLRRTLLFQTIKLIAAQGGYCLLAHFVILKGKPMPEQANPRADAIVLIGVAIAALFPILSAWVVRRFVNPPETTDWTGVASTLMRQLFVGYAISQMAALIGLFLFFVYGRVWAVVITAVFTSVGIIWHYLRIRQMTFEFEQQKL